MLQLGQKIVTSPLARDVRVEFQVTRHAMRKRRKNWCVRRVEINRPGAYLVGNTVFMHPDLYDSLRAHGIDGKGGANG